MSRTPAARTARTFAVLALAAVTGSMAGCSASGSEAGASAQTSATASAPATPLASASITPTGAPSPTVAAFKVLTKAQATSALLTVQDMPAGYAEDHSTDNTAPHMFCNYTEPTKPSFTTDRTFVKGGGMSAQLVRVGIRQYPNTDAAQAAFTALTDTLKTCHGETVNGDKATYELMSAPKVGEQAVGVRISGTATVLDTFVLDGPAMIVSGAGGLVNVDPDVATEVTSKQVQAYEAAATR